MGKRIWRQMAGGRECSRRRAAATTMFLVALLAALLFVSAYPLPEVKDDAVEYLTLARVRLGEGVFTGANDLLERLLALAETQKRTGSVIEILLTQALVHQAQDNQTQALAALERALTLAKPEGYLRTFADQHVANPPRCSEDQALTCQRVLQPLG